jgi:hypothetical protein
MRMPFRRFMALQRLAFKKQIKRDNAARRAAWQQKK